MTLIDPGGGIFGDKNVYPNALIFTACDIKRRDQFYGYRDVWIILVVVGPVLPSPARDAFSRPGALESFGNMPFVVALVWEPAQPPDLQIAHVEKLDRTLGPIENAVPLGRKG